MTTIRTPGLGVESQYTEMESMLVSKSATLSRMSFLLYVPTTRYLLSLSGSVTTASYGFSLRKMVAIGFVHDFDEESGTKRLLTREFVMSGQYEVEIAGERFPVEVKLNSPAIPKKVTATQYQPTRHEV